MRSHSPQASLRSSRGHVRQRKKTFPTWFMGILALVALVATVLLLRTFLSSVSQGDPAASRGNNRTWLARSWTFNEPLAADIDLLTQNLKRHEITTIYVWAGDWRRSEGRFIYVGLPYAEAFRRQMKAVAPDIRVLAWVYIYNGRSDQPDVNDLETHAEVINFARQAVNTWGYDGIHLQNFSTPDSSENFVRLLQAFDVAFGENLVLSITVPPDHQPADPTIPVSFLNESPSWGPRFKERISFLVDEVVLMAHAAGLETREEYENWLAYQVETYAEVIERANFDTDLIVALPTYFAEPLHDPAIENITTAITGTKDGIRRAGNAGKRVTGTGILTYETTTSQDWDDFFRLWVE